MFSKVIVLLLLAASAIAGVIPEGTYKITNAASQSTARVDYAGGPIYVSSDKRDPGYSEVWDLKDAEDNGYTISNIYLSMILMQDRFAAVRQPPMDGEPVVTNRDPTVFNIESAGDDTFVIKLPYDDLLWNVEPPVVPGGAVALRRANGEDTQKWFFTPQAVPSTPA